MIALQRDGDLLTVALGGLDRSDFDAAVMRVKAVPGHRFNYELKRWEFPATPDVGRQLLYSIEPDEVPPGFDIWLREAASISADAVVTKVPDDAAIGLPGQDVLYGYQRSGIEFAARYGHVIIADDMGGGKTAEAIGTIYEAEARGKHIPLDLLDAPVLVVTPNAVKGKWAAEIEEWSSKLTGEHPNIIIPGKTRPQRQKALRAIGPRDWVIVHWEMVRAEPMLQKIQWRAKIGDEAHREKNPKAQVSKSMVKIRAPLILLLTGTPVLNSPDELWNLLRDLRPDQYGVGSAQKVGYWRFYNDYVNYIEGAWGKEIIGVKNPDRLRFELSDKLVRRTKKEMLDLPEKTRVRVPIEMLPAQAKLYHEAETDFWLQVVQDIGEEKASQAAKALEAGDTHTFTYLIPNGAARVTRLRQILSTPALLGAEDNSAKLDAAVEIVTDHPEEQFVIFTAYRGTAEILKRRLESQQPRVTTDILYGGIKDPHAIEEEFTAGKLRVVIATIDYGGVGLDLQAASQAIFLERSWVPKINEQAEDRLHRIGQCRPVTIHIFEGRGTIDVGRIAVVNRKKDAISGAILPQDPIRTVKG